MTQRQNWEKIVAKNSHLEKKTFAPLIKLYLSGVIKIKNAGSFEGKTMARIALVDDDRNILTSVSMTLKPKVTSFYLQ